MSNYIFTARNSLKPPATIMHMNISKLYLKDKNPIPFLLKCKEKNSTIIKQVLKNNNYLLKKFKKKHKDQIKELRDQGVRISASGISKYRNGVFKSCAITYLQIFAEYWSIPLLDMMSRDFEFADSFGA